MLVTLRCWKSPDESSSEIGSGFQDSSEYSYPASGPVARGLKSSPRARQFIYPESGVSFGRLLTYPKTKLENRKSKIENQRRALRGEIRIPMPKHRAWVETRKPRSTVGCSPFGLATPRWASSLELLASSFQARFPALGWLFPEWYGSCRKGWFSDLRNGTNYCDFNRFTMDSRRACWQESCLSKLGLTSRDDGAGNDVTCEKEGARGRFRNPAPLSSCLRSRGKLGCVTPRRSPRPALLVTS